MLLNHTLLYFIAAVAMSPVVALPDQGQHAAPPPPAQLPRAPRHCHQLALHCVRLHLEHVMITPGHFEIVTSLTKRIVEYFLVCI